jgi:hypothetical protein
LSETRRGSRKSFLCRSLFEEKISFAPILQSVAAAFGAENRNFTKTAIAAPPRIPARESSGAPCTITKIPRTRIQSAHLARR